MSYNKFSQIYDRLIRQDVDYQKICDFIENVFDQYDISPELVLDLACGTGGVTIPLAQRGFDMIGVDKSTAMLNIAREKSPDSILYLNQDICSLDLYGTVGAVCCITDGLNYILSDIALKNALTRLLTCFMDNGAVLIFDVSSEHKLKTVHANNTFIYDTDDVFYAWENKYFPTKNLSDMCINFFCKDNHSWHRICERQILRARSRESIENILKNAGFININCYSSTEFAPYNPTAERLWFVAQKPF